VPSPKKKQVSDDSMAKVRTAIQTLAEDPSGPRTKRELQRRTGLSHDLIARAFRQDAEDPGRWQLSELFGTLTEGPSRRRTPDQAKAHQLKEQLNKRNLENALLRQQLDGAASVIVALQLQLGSLGDDSVIPLRPRNGRRP
jgi:hypothetical protein